MVSIYYLLYKLKNDDIYWIIKIDYDYYILKDLIKNAIDFHGNYYIVKRIMKDYSIIYKEFKRFQIFKLNRKDIILYKVVNLYKL